jgi:hypothetical protein
VKYSEYFGAKRSESFKNENIRYDSITLAYYDAAKVTAVKNVILQAPRLNGRIVFIFLIGLLKQILLYYENLFLSAM